MRGQPRGGPSDRPHTLLVCWLAGRVASAPGAALAWPEPCPACLPACLADERARGVGWQQQRGHWHGAGAGGQHLRAPTHRSSSPIPPCADVAPSGVSISSRQCTSHTNLPPAMPAGGAAAADGAVHVCGARHADQQAAPHLAATPQDSPGGCGTAPLSAPAARRLLFVLRALPTGHLWAASSLHNACAGSQLHAVPCHPAAVGLPPHEMEVQMVPLLPRAVQEREQFCEREVINQRRKEARAAAKGSTSLQQGEQAHWARHGAEGRRRNR